ncbi:MAG: YggS family pyridoxal phosphate-dependent enzyme [Christensenellaceae bacterium]|nr:YggS family pyridoxal phosphate-dependent enzyme [Christensenellaceae bacterium]
MDKIKFNLDQIISRANAVCIENGLDINSYEIVPATKTRSIELIKALIDDGRIKTCGENRVQEFVSKYTDAIQWDMIGRLQTNKVKYIIDKVRLIQSVDRLELLQEINKRAFAIGKVQKILLEVNTGAEENKGGVLFKDVKNLASVCVDYPNIKFLGVMAVAPYDINRNQLKYLFLKAHETFEILKNEYPSITYLSMGMSEDFELAIECGANMIRPGRIVFE